MCSIIVIILAAFVAQVDAKELEQSSHDTQGSVDSLLDEAVAKLVDKFFDQSDDVSLTHHTDLDSTTLGKPAQAALRPSPVSSASHLPALRPPPVQWNGRAPAFHTFVMGPGASGQKQGHFSHLLKAEPQRAPPRAVHVAATEDVADLKSEGIDGLGPPKWPTKPMRFSKMQIQQNADAAGAPAEGTAEAGGEEAPVVSSTAVAEAWANHYSAFGEQDLPKILQDYTDKSAIIVYNLMTGKKDMWKGLKGVSVMFQRMFESLYDTSDMAAPVQVVEEATADGPGTVFLVWECPASGYMKATDVFVFDSDGKILRQTVYMQYYNPKDDARMFYREDAKSYVYTKAPFKVWDAWANYFEAFEKQKEDMILKDYTDQSSITTYDLASGSQQVFRGLEGARECFDTTFKSLPDLSDFEMHLRELEEEAGEGIGIIFLAWSAMNSGYTDATDTFVFDKNGKIFRQYKVSMMGMKDAGNFPKDEASFEKLSAELAAEGVTPDDSAWKKVQDVFATKNYTAALQAESEAEKEKEASPEETVSPEGVRYGPIPPEAPDKAKQMWLEEKKRIRKKLQENPDYAPKKKVIHAQLPKDWLIPVTQEQMREGVQEPDRRQSAKAFRWTAISRIKAAQKNLPLENPDAKNPNSPYGRWP